MSQSESKEMYLETIYILQQEENHAHSADVAKRLNVSKPSVTKAMNALKEQGLIEQEKYGPITLTKEGMSIAKTVYENHHLITKFIISALNMSPDKAEKDACKIEHVISSDMVEAIKEYLK